MKKITQISLGLVAMSMMVLFTACPDGGGDGETPTCKDTEKLNEVSNTCVPACEDDDGCTDEVLNKCVTGADELLSGVCGCSADSCADGEVCHPTGNACVKACDSETACPTVGTDTYLCYGNETADADVCQKACEKSDDCGDGKYSVCYTTGDDAGKCKEACKVDGSDCGDGFTCMANGMCETGGCTGNHGTDGASPCSEALPICNLENSTCKAAPTALDCAMEDTAMLLGDDNACVAIADAPSSKCAKATAAGLTHSDGAPIIYEMSAGKVLTDKGTCGSDKDRIEFKAKVYAPNGGVYKKGGKLQATWFNLGGNPAISYVADEAFVNLILGDTYEVDFRLCISNAASTFAVVNSDKDLQADGVAGAKTSNSFCFPGE